MILFRGLLMIKATHAHWRGGGCKGGTPAGHGPLNYLQLQRWFFDSWIIHSLAQLHLGICNLPMLVSTPPQFSFIHHDIHWLLPVPLVWGRYGDHVDVRLIFLGSPVSQQVDHSEGYRVLSWFLELAVYFQKYKLAIFNSLGIPWKIHPGSLLGFFFRDPKSSQVIPTELFGFELSDLVG